MGKHRDAFEETDYLRELVRKFNRNRIVAIGFAAVSAGFMIGIAISLLFLEPRTSIGLSVAALFTAIAIFVITFTTSWVSLRMVHIGLLSIEKQLNDVKDLLKIVLERGNYFVPKENG